MTPEVTRRLSEGRLFCPMCGNPLSEREGEPYCEGGNTFFSAGALSLIEEGLAHSVDSPNSTRSPEKGLWWCPGCGGRLEVNEPAVLKCADCGFVTPLILNHSLLRRHSHK